MTSRKFGQFLTHTLPYCHCHCHWLLLLRTEVSNPQPAFGPPALKSFVVNEKILMDNPDLNSCFVLLSFCFQKNIGETLNLYFRNQYLWAILKLFYQKTSHIRQDQWTFKRSCLLSGSPGIPGKALKTWKTKYRTDKDLYHWSRGKSWSFLLTMEKIY